MAPFAPTRSEEHTSELQSRGHLVCRLLLEKKRDLLLWREGLVKFVNEARYSWFNLGQDAHPPKLGNHVRNFGWTYRHFLFFNHPATPEIYPLSLHDALPIFQIWLSFSISCFVTALARKIYALLNNF